MLGCERPGPEPHLPVDADQVSPLRFSMSPTLGPWRSWGTPYRRRVARVSTVSGSDDMGLFLLEPARWLRFVTRRHGEL